MNVLYIILIVVVGLSIGVNLLAFILEKVYKKRVMENYEESKKE